MKIIYVAAISIVITALSLVVYHQLVTVQRHTLLGDLSSQLQSMQIQLDASRQDNQRLEVLVKRIQAYGSPAPAVKLNKLPDVPGTPINVASGQAENTDDNAADTKTTVLKLDSVRPGSVMESQGLASGDEILFYDGRRVHDMQDIHAADASGYSGQLIQVEIQREGIPMTLMMRRGSFFSSRN